MYVGIDIGGTKTIVAFGDGDGRVHQRFDFATHEVFDDWYRHVLGLLQGPGSAFDGIGIGSIGPVDYRKGVIINPPAKARWRDLPIIDRLLSDKVTNRAYLDNDCNVAVMGEAAWGAARGADPVIYYTVSTGVGTGVWLDGRVLHGRLDTEGGHQIVEPDGPLAPCGHRGCLEGTVSGGAVMRQTGRRAEEIESPEFWDGIAAKLAIAMVNTTVLLSPEVIVIGGGVTRRDDAFFQPLRYHVARLFAGYQPLPPMDRYIVPAGLGQDSVVLGALRLAATGFGA